MVYVGTYTRGESLGIYRLRLDLETGKLTSVGVTEDVENPSFLAIHPTGRFLYAVNEVGNFSGNRSGAVSAFAIDRRSGALKLLNQQPSGGAGPCHLVVDRAGKHVLLANYGGGSIAALPLGEDGRLGPATAFVQHEGSSVNPRRQQAPHAHSINLDSANRFAFAADLGLDKVLIYRFDPQRGTLAAHTTPSASVAPGAGPRHFAFHPLGQTAYVINELASTITAFRYDARRGVLVELHTLSTLPEGFEGNNSTAEVQVHYTGKFVYGSNRGHDSIAVFAVDPKTGKLTAHGHHASGGKTPRASASTPLVATCSPPTRTPTTSSSTASTSTPAALQAVHETAVPTPVCVKFLTLP